MPDHSPGQSGQAAPHTTAFTTAATGFSEGPGAAYVAYPPELAFLVDMGVAPDAVMAAMARADELGVSAHDIIISDDRRTERAYFQALARALGLPFIDPRRAVIGKEAFSARTLASPLSTRILPLDHQGERHYALMPRGSDVAQLFSLMKRHDRPARLAIACPSDGREAMIAQAGDRVLATHMAPLLTQRPDLSAHDTPRRVGRFCALSLIALAGMALGVMGDYLSAVVPIALLTLALALIFGIGLGLRCALLVKTSENVPPRLADGDLPTYSVLVPVYREARMVRQLLTALVQIDYPAPFLEFLVLVEEDDHETQQAIASIDRNGRFGVLTVPPGLPRTKPRALQFGLAFARGEIVTIFDAEDVPAVDQLRRAAEALAAGGPRLACVQTPLVIDNPDASWLARQFALEYAALFQVIIPGLANLEMPVMLGGTSNHFRSDALRHVMGWDPWNVTEDADLGIRLARFGYRIGALASQTQEEAPAVLASWFSQHRRWLKGWMQTALVHLSQPQRLVRDLSWRGLIGIIGTLVVTLAATLVYPLSCIGMMVLFLNTGLYGGPEYILLTAAAVTLFVAGHGVAFLMIFAGARRSRLALRWRDILTLPAYWVLVSLAAWTALVDLALWPFHWAKTNHVGRSPQNR